MSVITVFIFIIIIVLFLYNLLKRRHDYWKIKNVPFVEPELIFGNYSEFIKLKTPAGFITKGICEKFPDSPYVGTFYGTEPALVVKDPDLISLIMVKDFFYFHGREVCKYVEKEVTTQSIFFTHGDKWRVLRHSLSPMFTTMKMKNMFHLIQKSGLIFENVLKENEKNDGLEITSTTKKFIIDCVGACIFGIELNTLGEGVENPIVKISKDIFPKSNSRGIINVLRSIWPSLFYAFGLKLFPAYITEFFVDLVTKAFKSRETKISTREDFIDLFLKFKQNNWMVGDGVPNLRNGCSQKVQLEVTDDLLIGQCVSFFGAAFETSSTTLSFTFYELAKNLQCQEKAIEEIDAYLKKNNNEINYDIVSETPYLNACLDEALRLYPSLLNLTREVMEDYTFPTGLTVKKGMRIHIPVYHIQHNPKYYEEPEKFIPERFLPEAIANIKPFTYMPFGEGHRVCIAKRFAKMQMLAGLGTVLKNYRITLDETTPRKLTIDPRVLVSTPIEDIKIKLIARSHV